MSTNYVKNRSPYKVTEDKTHKRMWSKRKPDVKHFRAFGCKAIVMKIDKKEGKFRPNTWWGTFVGYGGNSLGSRIWVPLAQQVPLRKNVKFRMNKFINYKQGDQKLDCKSSPNFIVIELQSPKREGPATLAIPQVIEEDKTATEKPIEPIRRSNRQGQVVERLTGNISGELHLAICEIDVEKPKSMKEAFDRPQIKQ